jgi:uncharacterized tellurite resistance protein B-like protein
MSIRDWFHSLQSAPAESRGDTDTVRRIVSELDKLDPKRARHLAAFAYVLSRVAAADLHVSTAETTRMVELLRQIGRLPEAQAILVVEIAKSQSRLFGGTENFLVTREFRDIASDAERRELIECLFAVAEAEAGISAEEEAQVRQIAGEVGMPDDEYLKIRLAHSGKRTVFRRDS